MDKRAYPRISINSMVIDICDGHGCYQGVIENFSRFGMAVSELSPRLNTTADTLTAVVNIQGKNFKMEVTAKWEEHDSWNKSIGIQIDTYSVEWMGFVMKMENSEQELATAV